MIITLAWGIAGIIFHEKEKQFSPQKIWHVHDIERGCGEKASEARKALSLFPNCFYDSGIIDPALPLSPTLSYSILGDMIGFTMMLLNACLKHNCSTLPFKTR